MSRTQVKSDYPLFELRSSLKFGATDILDITGQLAGHDYAGNPQHDLAKLRDISRFHIGHIRKALADMAAALDTFERRLDTPGAAAPGAAVRSEDATVSFDREQAGPGR